MKNKDKYREQIIEIAMNGDAFAVDKKTNEPVPCPRLASFCRICLFGKGTICSEARKEWLNQEVEILDEVEKEYLSAVIKPWKNRVLSMSIVSNGEKEYLVIVPKNIEENEIWLPSFKTGTMYKGMERYKNYKVEELGL